MWLVFAFVSAFATSLTTITAKIGIKNVNSDFATFYRTGIVILGSLAMCLITGSLPSFSSLTWENWLYLALSGLCTGLSWLCYYRAIKLGDVSKVAPIDKSSFILSSVLFLIFFFPETTKGGDGLTIGMLFLSMALMLAGTLLMIGKIEKGQPLSKAWLFYAVLSAVFAGLVSFFCKLGLSGIPTDLGTLIRTVIVFLFSGAIVLARKEYKGVSALTGKDWVFLSVSGLFTGVAWLSEYYALNWDGSNPIAVNSIGKLSILLTMLFSFLFLKEKFTKKSLLGLAFLTAGIVLIIVFSL